MTKGRPVSHYPEPAPCMGCGDREPKCHTDCGRYAKYKEKREEWNRKRMQERQLERNTAGKESMISRNLKTQLSKRNGGW